MLDILLIGATGYTGRLTAKYLKSHPQASSFTWGIAGRSNAKLRQLVADLQLPEDIPTFVVDTSNSSQVVEAVREAKIVINTVGPFIKYGTPVIQACVENGVHYVDITAEIHWIHENIAKYHETAQKSGTIIVHAAGTDSVPSELSAFIPRQTLNQHAASKNQHLDIDTSVTAWDLNTGISGGTLITLFTLLSEASPEEMRIAMEDHTISPYSGRPSPPNRLRYELQVPGGPKKVGGFYVMAPCNRAIVQRTHGLLEVQAQEDSSDEAAQLAYGPRFTYEEFMVTNSEWYGAAMSLALWVLVNLMKFSMLASFLKKLAPYQPGGGASDDELASGNFSLTLTNITTSVSTASNSEPVQVKTVVHGNHDGYVLTAVSLVESALAIRFDKESLPKLGKRGGILTPMTAFGNVLVERLKKSGNFTIQSEVLPSRR